MFKAAHQKLSVGLRRNALGASRDVPTLTATTPSGPKLVSSTPLALNCARPKSVMPAVDTVPATRISPFGSNANPNGSKGKEEKLVIVLPLVPKVVANSPAAV